MPQTRIEAAVVSTSTEVIVQGSQQRHRQTCHVQKYGRDQFTRQSNITYRKGNKVNCVEIRDGYRTNVYVMLSDQNVTYACHWKNLLVDSICKAKIALIHQSPQEGPYDRRG